jgi:hypothetical protein
MFRRDSATRDNMLLKSTIAILAVGSILNAGSDGLSIRLDDSFPRTVAGDLNLVAQDAVSVVEQAFENNPPPLLLPIACISRRTAIAQTSLDDWFKPAQFQIRVTVSERYYAQFAFQLGHELGHVMIGVRRSNSAFEALATAVSFEVLDRLAARWQSRPPYPDWAYWAPNFTRYREEYERNALTKTGLSEAWRRHRLDLIRTRLEQEISASPLELSRELQAVAAMAVRSDPFPWRRIIGLEDCTDPDPASSSDYRLQPPLRDCVAQRARELMWLVPQRQGL